MLSATFGDEIVGRDQCNSTDGDVDDRVRFLGFGSILLGLSIGSHLSELALRRLLGGSGLLGLVEQTANTDLGKAWENWSGNFADASNEIGEARPDVTESEIHTLHSVGITKGGGELIAHRTGDVIVHRVAESVGDVVDVSHGSNSNQPVPISGSGHILGAWVNENCLPLVGVLDDDMVVVIAPVELHSDGSSRNTDGNEHCAQENDMVVAVSVGDTLSANGVEQDQRGLHKLPAIRISEVDHLPHHERCNSGSVVSDVVVDAGRNQRKSRCPDAWISAKLIDHKLNRGDDRERIRGSRIDGNPMNGPIRCEQVFPDGDPGCRLVIRLACQGLGGWVDYSHEVLLPQCPQNSRALHGGPT